MKVLTRDLQNGVVITNGKGNVMIQRGSYTLAAGTVSVTFSTPYVDTTDLIVILQSNTANHQYPSSITVTGFTANGTGTDTGKYIAIGNTKL